MRCFSPQNMSMSHACHAWCLFDISLMQAFRLASAENLKHSLRLDSEAWLCSPWWISQKRIAQHSWWMCVQEQHHPTFKIKPIAKINLQSNSNESTPLNTRPVVAGDCWGLNAWLLCPLENCTPGWRVSSECLAELSPTGQHRGGNNVFPVSILLTSA